jgi:hypothetical protein
MRKISARWRKFAGFTAVIAGMAVGILGFMAVAETPSTEETPAAGLIGASVYSVEGTEVGTVSVVSIGQDGYISEIRFTRPSPVGSGDRTVAVYPDAFIALDGAVVLELSADEVDALPVQTVGRGMPS